MAQYLPRIDPKLLERFKKVTPRHEVASDKQLASGAGSSLDILGNLHPGGVIVPIEQAQPPAPEFVGPPASGQGSPTYYETHPYIDPGARFGIGPDAVKLAPTEAPAALPGSPTPPPPAAPVGVGFKSAEAAVPKPFQFSAGGGGGVIPAHDVSTISPETRRQGENALENVNLANKMEAQAEIDQAEKERQQGLKEAGQDIFRGTIDVRQAARKEAGARTALNDFMSTQDAMDREAAAGTLNPDHFTQQLGTGGRMLAGLSILLGGIGQGTIGGPNGALQVIQTRIDRDIAAQRENLANNWRKADAHRSQFAMNLKRFGDPDIAEAATKAEQSKLYAAMAKQEALKTQSPILQAKYLQVAAAGDAAAAKYTQDTHHYVQAQVTGGGITMAQMQAKYHDYVLDQLKKPGGVAVDFPTFLQSMQGAGGASAASRPGSDKGKLGNLTVPAPTSSEWSPVSRNIQGTPEFRNAQSQDQWNSQVMGVMHQVRGARSPEAMKEVGGAYLVNKGDSQDTIDSKVAAFHRDFPPETPLSPPQTQTPTDFNEAGEEK